MQYGADFIRLSGDSDIQIIFTGSLKTPILGVLPYSGTSFWWSGRADGSLATLQRTVDLTNTDAPTMTYSTWYDLEAGFDYATLECSSDGGETWQILSVPSGSDEDPEGNNPGWGYTGTSGTPAAWIDEVVDLSPCTAAEAEIRFSTLTDATGTGEGFVVDDIAIPQIGLDDVEDGTSGWEARGFVRTDNFVKQEYLVLLVSFGDEIGVERLPVEVDQTATWEMPLESAGWREAILIFSGMAPLTHQPAFYQMAIEN
ncbi:MAG: immune inhibitor A [Anaerolineae bacterium]|nr:immune inhibitor A [Anaerolineae bacterium]